MTNSGSRPRISRLGLPLANSAGKRKSNAKLEVSEFNALMENMLDEEHHRATHAQRKVDADGKKGGPHTIN